MYGDTILIYMNDSTIERAHIKQFAFAIQMVDTTYYNQLKGSDLQAWFEAGSVRRIDVEGNAESIFYPIDEADGAMIGLNKMQSGYMRFFVKDNKLEKLTIWPSPVGSITPIPDLTPDSKTLKDFHWFDYIRPLDKDDIYRVTKKAVQDAPRRSNKFVN